MRNYEAVSCRRRPRQFLLRRLPRNMAALCTFLDELDAASLVAQRRLTVPFVKAVMKSA